MKQLFPIKQLTNLTNNRHLNLIVSKVSDYAKAGSRIILNEGKKQIYGPSGKEILKNIDLSGKTCLITGGTSGIGREIIKCLVSNNCDVIMACRNPYAAALLRKSLQGGYEHLTIKEVNLASIDSVKKLTEKLIEEEKSIDMLILNAGVFGIPWNYTIDGLETTFQVNFLSQYYLVQNIVNILSYDARVVFMSSESHRNIKLNIDMDTPLTEEVFSLPEANYTSIKAYNLSKLCGLYSMHVLSYKWSDTKRSVFCANPGSFIKTNLPRNWWVWENLYEFLQPFTKTVQQAAATPLYCCASPDLAGETDLYLSNCQHCEESDLAKDLRVAYKADGLFQAIMTDRDESIEYKEYEPIPIVDDEPTQRHTAKETNMPNLLLSE